MKRLAALSLALLLLLSLVSCHGAKEKKGFEMPDDFDGETEE